ncbi:MAG: hypothetical protein ACJA0H_000590, partial [Francisellaceae bacterium]
MTGQYPTHSLADLIEFFMEFTVLRVTYNLKLSTIKIKPLIKVAFYFYFELEASPNRRP